MRWKKSGSGYAPEIVVIGSAGAIPMVGDFDGDGKVDPATWNPGTKMFRWKESGNGYAPNGTAIMPSTGVPVD
jgi:hypothetical protein